MKNVLTAVILSIGILFSVIFGSFQVFANRCSDVTEEVLRLHIPANSDSDEDQAIKLKVRDMVLEEFGEELSGFENVVLAEERASELIPEIEKRCTEYLHENGFSYDANAELVTMYFTTREYDRLILPAGEYHALRITLGSGEGHNWWCVIFPQLCLPAASEKSTEENSQDENAENVLDAFGKPQKIKVKFAIYEWLQELFG